MLLVESSRRALRVMEQNVTAVGLDVQLRRDPVEDVVRRDHGHEEGYRVAEQQSDLVGRLIGDGQVADLLVVCRTPIARSAS